MNIAILGFGTVGQGIYQLLEARRAALEAECGQELRVKSILVRDLQKKRGSFPAAQLPLTDSFDEILADDSIEIVFEVMSDGPKGIDYIRQLLARRKHVISANKAAIAGAFFELQNSARAAGVHFRFEAAAAGGIPLIAPLGKIRQLNAISYLGGIINSSTNYILSELSLGKSQEEVFAEALTLGVLEEDPTNGVEGYDARRKIAILASMILAQEIQERDIPTSGISELSEEDFAWAGSERRRLKLIAALKQDDCSYSLSVLPTALAETNPLAAVGGIMNQVRLEGDTIGSLVFSGTGGGMLSTAHGLWADFLDVISCRPTYYTNIGPGKADHSGERTAAFYLREAEKTRGEIEQISVQEALSLKNKGFTIIELA